MGKPGPMDDDVLKMTKICATVIGRKWHDDEHAYYWPAESGEQAFELLCWLAERAEVRINGCIFHFRPPPCDHEGNGQGA